MLDAYSILYIQSWEVYMSREEILAKLAGKRTRCMVYTRVMGYHRPVESFNVGKTGEHRERVQFEESACSRKCS